MASFSLSSLSLINTASSTSASASITVPGLTFFPELPLEVQRLIWRHSAMEPEIISVEIRRRVQESDSKLKQVKGFTHAKGQLKFNYEATSGRIDLNGDRIAHSTIRSVCHESRTEYFKVRSAELYIVSPRGKKIHFNPCIDILHFSDLSSIYAHNMRQRYRRDMPMIKGLDAATKIAFDPVVDNERIEDLGEAVLDEYESSIIRIQQDWARNGKSFRNDAGWGRAREREGNRLNREMRPRNIRISKALGRVNGAFQDENATILRFPLTQADLQSGMGREVRVWVA